MANINTNGPANSVHIVSGAARWEAAVPQWTDLPGAEINLGALGTPGGATFVATFSAEALASGPDGGLTAIFATVFFDNAQGVPVSNNHRFVTSRGNPEWSSHTFIRTSEFTSVPPNLVARVRFVGSPGNAIAGIQNWVLKIERFNH